MFNVAEVMGKIAESIETEAAKRFDKMLERNINLNDFLMELALIGINVKVSQYELTADYPITVDITEEELKILRRHFRTLEQVSIEPVHSNDARRKEVYIKVEPKHPRYHRLIYFRYVTKLTKDKKCKIVKQKSSSYTTIMCTV